MDQRVDRTKKALEFETIIELINTDSRYTIKELCSLFLVSRAAYYKYINKNTSDSELRDKYIIDRIIELNEKHKGILGYRRMTMYINKELETNHSLNYIRRLMRLVGIKAIIRQKRYNYKKYKPHYTKENILNREFIATKPNEKWLTDVTEFKIPNSKDKLYLSPILDLYDNSIVSYTIGRNNNNILVFKAFKKAIKKNDTRNTLIHSDRGFQYTSPSFKILLKKANMNQSMSRPGKCIDNGPMEGFFGTLKSEFYYNKKYNFKNEKELIKEIKQYIDYYNNERFQKKLKGLAPNEFRAKAFSF